MNREELLKIAKPILFNTEMVQAIIDNRKTVTRRIVKYYNRTPITDGRDKFYKIDENLNGNNPNRLYAGFYNDNDIFYIDDEKHIDGLYYPLYFKVGDILYVQETWQIHDLSPEFCMMIRFKADNHCELQVEFKSSRFDKFEKFYYKNGWQSPYFMPKEAARIFLKVTDVKVERLQNITEEQAVKEGCITFNDKIGNGKFDDVLEFDLTAKDAFVDLWNSTLKKDSACTWMHNPYVWVIEFERVLSDEYN
jgi:hypothetical protein